MNVDQPLKMRRSCRGLRRGGASVLAAMGLIVCGGVALPAGTAIAGETASSAVFEVEVEIESGRERWKNGTEWRDGAFSQSFTLNIPYVAARSLDSVNPYDPDYGATALRKAAEDQSRAAAIARRGGSGASPFNTVLDPGKLIQVDPERLADLAARSQACNGDRTCLMALGLEIMAEKATDQDAALVQTMQQISTECSATVGMADAGRFDACLQEKGSRYAMVPNGIDTSDTGPGFAEPAPDRFQRWDMNWASDGGCGATVVADYRYEAAEMLNDVTGPVAGKETAVGASEGAVVASEMPVVCSSNQIVTDVWTGKMYIQTFYMPAIPVHQTIRSKLRGGLLESTVNGGLPGGPDIVSQGTVTQWITAVLKNAPLNGRAERAFKIKGSMNGVSRPTGTAATLEILPDGDDPTAWKRQAPNFHETEFLAKVTWRLKEMTP
ncbi:hypothetical protein [Shinella sp. M27]|uniref:hypothetical protein n=1 Tax=Shinella sp. M27 TaxID=3368614 RepID=UPI003B9F0CDB